MSNDDCFEMVLDGPTDVAFVEEALDVTNETFSGKNINTCMAFAITFLVSMIVIYERATDRVGLFDVDALRDKINEALKTSR